MAALRAMVFLVFQLVTLVPISIACLLALPLPLRVRYRLAPLWTGLVIRAAHAIHGIRWCVIGRENLPDAPVILLSKHQSTWETLFFPWYLPRELCYVFKRELLYLPFFGWAIATLRMIHIDRSKGSNAFESVVRQGARKLAEGRSVIMFPEGTRTPVGSHGRYKTGGARLAVRTGALVVPIAVNSGECWPRNSFVKRPGLITVSIGKPISPLGRSAEELSAEVERWIEAEMRKLSPHLYRRRAKEQPLRNALSEA